MQRSELNGTKTIREMLYKFVLLLNNKAAVSLVFLQTSAVPLAAILRNPFQRFPILSRHARYPATCQIVHTVVTVLNVS